MDSDLEEGEIKDDIVVDNREGCCKPRKKADFPLSEKTKSNSKTHLPASENLRSNKRQLSRSSSVVEIKTNDKTTPRSSAVSSSRSSHKSISSPKKNLGTRVGKKTRRRRVEVVEQQSSSSHNMSSSLIIRVNHGNHSSNKKTPEVKERSETSTISSAASESNASISCDVLYPSVCRDSSLKNSRSKENTTRLNNCIGDVSDVSDPSDDEDNRSIISLELPSKEAPELITLDSTDSDSVVDEDVEVLNLRRVALQDLMSRLNEVKNLEGSDVEGNDSVTCEEDEEPYSPFDEDPVDKNLLLERIGNGKDKDALSLAQCTTGTTKHVSMDIQTKDYVSLSNKDLNGGLSEQQTLGDPVTLMNSSTVGNYNTPFMETPQFYPSHMYMPPLGAGDIDMRINNFYSMNGLNQPNSLPFVPLNPSSLFQHNQQLPGNSVDMNPFVAINHNLHKTADVFGQPHAIPKYSAPSAPIESGVAFRPVLPFATSNPTDAAFIGTTSFASINCSQWPFSVVAASDLGENSSNKVPCLHPPLPEAVLPPPLPPLPKSLPPPPPPPPLTPPSPPSPSSFSFPNQSLNSDIETIESASTAVDHVSSSKLSSTLATENCSTIEIGFVHEHQGQHIQSHLQHSPTQVGKMFANQKEGSADRNATVGPKVYVPHQPSRSRHKSSTSDSRSSTNTDRNRPNAHNKTKSSPAHRPSSSRRRQSSDHSDRSGSSQHARRGSYKSRSSPVHLRSQRRKQANLSPSPIRQKKRSFCEESVSTKHHSSEPHGVSRMDQVHAHNNVESPAVPHIFVSDISKLKENDPPVLPSSVITKPTVNSHWSDILISVNNEKVTESVRENSSATNSSDIPVASTSNQSMDALNISIDDEEILRAQLLLDIARKKTVSLPTTAVSLSSEKNMVTHKNASVGPLFLTSANKEHSQVTSVTGSLLKSSIGSSVLSQDNQERPSALQPVSNPRSKNRQIVRVINTGTGGNFVPGANLTFKKTIINNNVHSKANLNSIQRTVVNTNLLKKNVYNQNADPVMRHLKITVPNKVVTPLIIPLRRDESSSEDEGKEKQPKTAKTPNSICKSISNRATSSSRSAKCGSKILPEDFEASLNNLLKASRQQTGKVVLNSKSKSNSTPVVLKHLPASKRAEYIRLKTQIQEHERKIRKKLDKSKQALKNSSTVATLSSEASARVRARSLIPPTNVNPLQPLPAVRSSQRTSSTSIPASQSHGERMSPNAGVSCDQVPAPNDGDSSETRIDESNLLREQEFSAASSEISKNINQDGEVKGDDVSEKPFEVEDHIQAEISVSSATNRLDLNSVPGKENTLVEVNRIGGCNKNEERVREDGSSNILREGNIPSEPTFDSASKSPQHKIVYVTKEKEELYLREKLLKAALLKKMKASNDTLTLRKFENDIISSRRSINQELTSLLSEMVQMSDLKVVLKEQQDKVNLLREQLHAAESKLHAAGNKLQAHERKRKDLTTRVFSMRKECVSLIKQCRQQGNTIEGSKYKIPTAEALEMKTKLIEVRHQNLVFQTYKRPVHPSATRTAANRIRKSSHTGFKGKRGLGNSHINAVHGFGSSNSCVSHPSKWTPTRNIAGRPMKKHRAPTKGQKSTWLTKHNVSDDDWEDQSIFLLPKMLYKDVMANSEPPPKKRIILKPVIPFRVYESPLDSIREQNQLSDSSPCVIRNLDPFVTLCYFELRGMCSSTTCAFQHLYRPTRKAVHAK